MIHFYAARKHRWTVDHFVRDWAPHLVDRIRLVPYDAVAYQNELSPGVHILADLERLLPQERVLAGQLHRRLARHPETHRSLQDPRQWSGRFGLLSQLSDAGINDFRAHREWRLGDVRYPAFVRWENNHAGSIGEPVDSRAEVRDRLAGKVTGWKRLLRHQLMVVEMLDARGPDGLYRKYSAQRVGDRIIPRHVMFTHGWITKYPDVVTEETVREENEYLLEFPHADQVRAVFEMSGLKYGRIDYGFVNGRMQVWEINTNPVLVVVRKKVHALRLPSQSHSAAAIVAALEELDASVSGGSEIKALGPASRAMWRAQGRVSRAYDAHRR